MKCDEFIDNIPCAQIDPPLPYLKSICGFNSDFSVSLQRSIFKDKSYNRYSRRNNCTRVQIQERNVLLVIKLQKETENVISWTVFLTDICSFFFFFINL